MCIFLSLGINPLKSSMSAVRHCRMHERRSTYKQSACECHRPMFNGSLIDGFVQKVNTSFVSVLVPFKFINLCLERELHSVVKIKEQPSSSGIKFFKLLTSYLYICNTQCDPLLQMANRIEAQDYLQPSPMIHLNNMLTTNHQRNARSWRMNVDTRKTTYFGLTGKGLTIL